MISPNLILSTGLGHALRNSAAFRVACTVAVPSAVPAGTRADITIVDLSGSADLLAEPGPGSGRLVALCAPERAPDLATLLEKGCLGLVSWDAGPERLLAALTAVLDGGLYIDPALVGPVTAQLVRPHRDVRRLPKREAETLRLIALGLTHGQIGRRLGLTESTVSTYVKRIRGRLNAGNKAELVRLAIELGYV